MSRSTLASVICLEPVISSIQLWLQSFRPSQAYKQTLTMLAPARRSAKPSHELVASTEHCLFCFDTLIAYLSSERGPVPVFPNADCPLFVTWNISAGHAHWRLRGCIGTLEPRQLHTALKDYTLTSALRDTRFSPIQLKEVPSLKCTVSLLSCFEPAADWTDWEVGVHGLIIKFTDPEMSAKRTATFLPEVAHEQGWNHEECIDSLIRKAGYAGRVSNQLRQSLQVERYQSTTATMTYAEFMAANETSENLTPAVLRTTKVAA